MGQVISFSEFDRYHGSISDSKSSIGTLIDTNILVSLSYEVKSNHEEVVGFFSKIESLGIKYYATVNTKAEFLDFHRRLLMTENLRDMIDPSSKWKIASSAKAQIQVQSGQLTRREQQGGDPIFTDTQIKKIKSSFSAGRHSGQSGWLSLCSSLLTGRLQETEAALLEHGIEYISQHESSQTDLFQKRIDWPGARSLSEQTCLSISDSMILNALQCSRFPFMISSDFDIGYAALASLEIKDVVVPDSLAKKYREYHFDH
jgi:hypothetical protein